MTSEGNQEHRSHTAYPHVPSATRHDKRFHVFRYIQGYIQKFPDWVDNEINNNNKHSLRSNAKGYRGKIQQSDSQNSDTTAPSGRGLYHLQFSLQTASSETFGYILVHMETGFKLTSQIFVRSLSYVMRQLFLYDETFWKKKIIKVDFGIRI
jgi:hypothetical protein